MKKCLKATSLSMLLVIFLCSCSSKLPANKVYSAVDMQGKTVGVLSGSAAESYVSPYGSMMNIRTYTDVSAMAAELKSGGLDCAVADESRFAAIKKSSSSLTYLDERFIDRSYCLALSADNSQMLEKLDAAILAAQNDGTIDSIVSGWKNGDGYAYDYSESDSADVIAVAIDPTFEPYAYYNEENELVGLEIDIVRELCSRLNLKAEFTEVSSDKLLYMAESGKVSFAIGRIINDSQNENILYTQPYDTDVELIVVRKD
jgi:ABC-type amino acid transport substrate-binding protein